jgi:anti-sigma factor RsiW
MTDQGLDTIVAGIRCREVLADLSDYADGDLPHARVRELQAHLAGCGRCSRFGGDVMRVIASLREGLATPVAAAREPDVIAVVLQRIRRAG